MRIATANTWAWTALTGEIRGATATAATSQTTFRIVGTKAGRAKWPSACKVAEAWAARQISSM